MAWLRFLKVIRVVLGAAIVAVLYMAALDYYHRSSGIFVKEPMAQADAAQATAPQREPASVGRNQSAPQVERPLDQAPAVLSGWQETAQDCLPDISGSFSGANLTDIVSTIKADKEHVQASTPWQNWHFTMGNGESKRVRMEHLRIGQQGQPQFEVKIFGVDDEGLPIVQEVKAFPSGERALEFVQQVSKTWTPAREEVNQVYDFDGRHIDSIWVDDEVVALATQSSDGWFLECAQREQTTVCHCTTGR